MSNLPPLRREVLVEADAAFAFSVFTEQIGSWWPVAELSVHGAEASVSFEDGMIIEQSPAGERTVWGAVTDWRPGQALSFTWHPGHPESQASTVTVNFYERGRQTLVVLEHSGWEVFAQPEAAREEYGHGWPSVLSRYAEHTAAKAPWTWVALMHSPGPGAPAGSSLMEDPRFLEHVAFLRRMGQAGYLVAAGPLGSAGAGMTVLRLPGAGREADAARLANEDDGAVRSGLLQVEVRPWDVMLHAVGRPSVSALG